MKVTIIYDNTSFRDDLESDWGFSALVEVVERKILFDTGANGSILLSNMEKLGVDPRQIDDVFISHSHHDHTGGLSAFLEQNEDVKVWVPISYGGVKHAKEVIKIEKAQSLYKGIYSTGELDGIEQFLCIKTGKGLVVIAGCSHPQMEHILDVAAQFGSVYGIIGGLHGNKAGSLEGLDLICATHCTQHISEIKSQYPQKYVEGGIGQIIELQ
ncbi:MBL fold metallo-hydrolase [Fodinibius sediminis]|uniref:7,8-dihydropterin-6-yl-methyl-4-(Beta-D-ribofuranosyl)aminobenzene 5'-phosphate synthase n=1 Tax=Fodinibius sediminis TaxID=1214077 RepID=A0A521F2K7_9BACT|nr:MBL fold metallo-hydrolase [Fodinibius sediminis]SMO89720.1 7,8-dihydropterin-6-yl-methyl-4-(beta-D-ribofuranosyl)aminobenzene 5'-phosphate synthase [Fodinibius sediminis]